MRIGRFMGAPILRGAASNAGRCGFARTPGPGRPSNHADRRGAAVGFLIIAIACSPHRWRRACLGTVGYPVARASAGRRPRSPHRPTSRSGPAATSTRPEGTSRATAGPSARGTVARGGLDGWWAPVRPGTRGWGRRTGLLAVGLGAIAIAGTLYLAGTDDRPAHLQCWVAPDPGVSDAVCSWNAEPYSSRCSSIRPVPTATVSRGRSTTWTGTSHSGVRGARPRRRAPAGDRRGGDRSDAGAPRGLSLGVPVGAASLTAVVSGAIRRWR